MIPKLTKSKKILAINFGGIGDEVLFLPTLQCIRDQYPGCHITLMLEPRSRSIEQISQLIDDVITFDIKKRPLFFADLVMLVEQIRDGGYEMIVSSGSSKLVSILLFLAGSDWRIGYDSGFLSRALLSHAVPLNRDVYAGQMYLDLATPLVEGGRMLHTDVPRIDINDESMERMRAFFKEKGTAVNGVRKVILHPGTSKLAITKGIIKTWPVESWVKLIEMLDLEKSVETYLAGGPDDKEIIEKIIAALPKSSRVINCYGVTRSLSDLAAMIKLSNLIVCVDSAPMHIAVGCRTRCVAMFSATDPTKLLPNGDSRFLALSDGAAAEAVASGGKKSSSAVLTLGGPGVQLPPGTVFRCVLDQLQESIIPESRPALHL